MGASNGKAWQDFSVEELAVAVEGFGIAYKKYAAFVRANAVDGAMVVDCGGVDATLDMCEPPPNKLHRRKFLRELDANAQAVQAAKDAADKAAVEAALVSSGSSVSHAEKEARDEDMPASVREFVPLSSVVWIKSLATAMPLRKAELTIQRNPHDEEACTVAREAVQALAAAIKHAAEARCNEPKIAAKVRTSLAWHCLLCLLLLLIVAGVAWARCYYGCSARSAECECMLLVPRGHQRRQSRFSWCVRVRLVHDQKQRQGWTVPVRPCCAQHELRTRSRGDSTSEGRCRAVATRRNSETSLR